MTITATLLTTALVATVGNAATVMDFPLPFSIYEGGTGCKEMPMASGTIMSVKAMPNEFGAFCESTIQNTELGDELSVHTKVIFTSCDAVELGYVFADAYTCADSFCMDCSDKDGIPVPAELILPEYKPLPSADTCWGIQATSTGVTVLNKFDEGANTAAIDTYWSVYTDNSCIKDTVTIVTDDSSQLSAGYSVAASTTTALAMVSLVAALL